VKNKAIRGRKIVQDGREKQLKNKYHAYIETYKYNNDKSILDISCLFKRTECTSKFLLEKCLR